MNKQKRLALIGTAVLLVAVTVVLALKVSPNDKQRIRIGADITLSGNFGYFGKQLEKGLRLAEKESNQDRTKPPVELLVRDNRHDAMEATAIFERFAKIDKVSAAISLYSPMSKTVNGKAVEYGIPLVTTYTTAKDITNGWTFRDFPGMDEQVPPLAKYAAKSLRLRNVSCVIYQADFARDARDAFEKEFVAQGGKVLRSDEVPIPKAAELVPDAIDKAISGKPDGIFVVLTADSLGLALKRLRDTGYKGAIFSVIMFDSPEVYQVAGSAANGVYFSSVPVNLDQSEDGRRFGESYSSSYGAAPDYMAVYGYTIGKYLIAAARDAGGERRGTLARLKLLDVQSIRGRITVQPNGNIRSPVQMFRFQNGKGAPIYGAGTTP